MGKKAERKAAMQLKYQQRKAEERQLGLLAQEKDRIQRAERKHASDKRAAKNREKLAGTIAIAEALEAADQKEKTA